MMSFTEERISERVWKIVEDDPYGQYPFIYVIQGVDKVILIDTGCGGNRGGVNLKNFISSRINHQQLPFLVVCTHVHFDHVGGNHLFSGGMGILMGSNAVNFTNNVEINSLAHSRGCKIPDFTVTKWLKEKDLIYLDDANPSPLLSLEVIITPGHTPDSISLLCHWENRIFIGDTIYPYTAIHVDCLGSNLLDYLNSLKKLKEVIKMASIAKQIEQSNNNSDVQNVPQNSSNNNNDDARFASLSKPQQDDYQNFMAVAGLESLPFSLVSFLESFSWNLEQALNSFLSEDIGDISAMFPFQNNQPQQKFENNSTFNLSCGHVEANLDTSAIDDMLTFISFIKMGLVSPVHLDEDGYAEFTNERFTIILSQKQLAAVPDDFIF